MASSAARDVPLVADEGSTLEVSENQVRMVYLTVFLDTIGSSISTPVLPYYAETFNVGAAEVGYLFGAWSLMASIFPPILGRLADRIGRRPVLVMSLFGAGCAAMVQGAAGSYAMLFVGRALSGIWGAVGSTAQVYITDVAPPAIRGKYLTTVSTVPLLGVIFGPGIGGLLSKVSLSFPIVLDGSITIATAIAIAFLLVETPSFLRERAARIAAQEETADPTSPVSRSSPVGEIAPVSLKVHIIGISTFFFGISFGTMVSMYAVCMKLMFETTAMEVGLVFMGSGVVMVLTNLILVERIKKRFGVTMSAVLGTLYCGVLQFIMAEVSIQWLSAGLFILSSVGNSMRMATNPAIVAEQTTTASRGKIFGIIMRYQMFGRFLGPIIMGHLADRRADLPFVVGGLGASVLSSLSLLLASRLPGIEDQSPTTPQAASMQPQPGTSPDKPRESA